MSKIEELVNYEKGREVKENELELHHRLMGFLIALDVILDTYVALDALCKSRTGEWQLCPVCNGSGVVETEKQMQTTVLHPMSITCHSCGGLGRVLKVA